MVGERFRRGSGGSETSSSSKDDDAEKSTREQRQDGAREKVMQQAKEQAQQRAFGRGGPTSGGSSTTQKDRSKSDQQDQQSEASSDASSDERPGGRGNATDETSQAGDSAGNQPEPESRTDSNGKPDKQSQSGQQQGPTGRSKPRPESGTDSAGKPDEQSQESQEGDQRRRPDGRFKPEDEPERDENGQFQSGDGPRPRQQGPASSGPSDTVGNDGPDGQAPTERQLFGGRDDPPRKRGVNADEDEGDGEDVAEAIAGDEDRLNAPGGVDKGGDPTERADTGSGSNSDEDYTGLEDTGSREKYHLGLEHGEGQDLAGLEDQDQSEMDEDVAQTVSKLDQQVQENYPGLDRSDYAIRRNDDRVYVEYDDTAIANTIAESITAENENVDRGDFAVQKTDEGRYEVKWGDHVGETEAVNQLEQNVREQYPTITSEDYAIREAEDGRGYTVEIDPGFQQNAAADRFTSQNPNLERGEDFEVVGTDGGGFQIELTEEGQKEQYRQRVAEQNQAIDADDIVVEERNPDPEELRPEELKQYAENPYRVQYSEDYLREQAAQRVEQQYPEADSDDYSVSVSESGGVSVSFGEEFQRQQVAEQVAANNENIDEGDIASVYRKDGPEGRNKARLPQEVEGGSWGIELTESKQRELLRERAQEQHPDAESIDIVENEQGDLEASIQQPQGEQREQFGNFELVVPGTGGESVEDYFDTATSGISTTTQQVSSGLFDEGGPASESLGGEVLEAAGHEQAATAYEESLRSFGKGLTEGAGSLLNVPAAARGLDEGVEYVGWMGSETLQGRGGQALGQSVRAAATVGGAAVDYATKNPAKFTGTAVGSLAGSYTLMGGAAKVSSRAGTAVRWGIQPGEELASSVLTRGLSKTSTGSKIVSKFPGGRIDNEEIVIEGAKKGVQKTRSSVNAARRATSDLKAKAAPEVRKFLLDDRGQGQMPRSRAKRKQKQKQLDPEEEGVDIEERAKQFVKERTYKPFDPDQEMETIPDELKGEVSEINDPESFLPDADEFPSQEAYEAELERAQARANQQSMSPEEVVQETSPAQTAQDVEAEAAGTRRPNDGATSEVAADANAGSFAREAEAGGTLRPNDGAAAEVAADPNAGSFGRTELNFGDTMQDAQETVMEEAAQKQVQNQQAWEQVMQRQSADLGSEWDTESDVLGEVGEAFGPKTRARTKSMTEFETMLEEEFGTRATTDTELEQEWEQEFEQELEFETETETESEPPGGGQSNRGQQDLLAAFGTFSKQYRNPVASAEEVLGWE